MPVFSIQESIVFGWNEVKNRFFLFIGLFILTLGSDIAGQFFLRSWSDKAYVLAVVLFLFFLVIGLFLRLGFLRAVLDRVDGKEVSFDRLLIEYRHVLSFLVAGFIYACAVVVGLMLLILPGIFIAVALSFFPFLMIDRNLGPFASLKESLKVTKGYRGRLTLFLSILVGINLLGVLFFVVGLLVTFPLSVVAYAHGYRKIVGEGESFS